jgi:hypothetical protein
MSFNTNDKFNTLTGSTIQSTTISASVVSASSFIGGSSVSYITSSTTSSLTQIEVADFSGDVAVTFVDGRLKFIFGTPALPSAISIVTSGFNTDRFNKVSDNYDITGSWNNGAYTIISASLYTGSTLLNEVGTGTSVSYNTTTSGSQIYRLQYTASSPLDGSQYSSSATVIATVTKTNPANPTVTITNATIELGTGSNQIEQGATGSVTFTSASANPSNSWLLTGVTSNYASPLSVVGSLTGSSNIIISATASYYSPIGDNDPNLNTTTFGSFTYTKIRSLRYGASTSGSFTADQLADIRSWDTTLGGTIGTIDKGNTVPSGDTITITWSGDKYHYIVYDSARSNLTSISAGGTNFISQFTLSTVGNYKVYKSNDLQAGGGGTSTIYTLT